MQTNPNQQQIVKQREYELQSTIRQNISTPGVRDLLELAQIKADAAHQNYLKAGPDPQVWALEKAWLEIARTIEHGPKMDKITQPGGVSNG